MIHVFLKLKFVFSKKATKIDKIFTIDLTLLHNVKLTVKISSIFVAFRLVAFLENMNFNLNFASFFNLKTFHLDLYKL